MNQFTSLKQLKDFSKELYDHFSALNLVPNDLADLDVYLGGYIFVAEGPEDVRWLQENLHGRVDHYSESPEGSYMCMTNISNNSGGSTYCVHYEDWCTALDPLVGDDDVVDPNGPDLDSVDETNYDPYSGCDTFETDRL